MTHKKDIKIPQPGPVKTNDIELILKTYWPVIEEARKVRERYTPAIINSEGAIKRTPALICPDETAAMIEALNDAESVINIERNAD